MTNGSARAQSQLIPCPKCQVVDLVRFETVITGTHVSRNYYCGGCDHHWLLIEPENGGLGVLLRRARAKRRHH
jgi:hypothetical protein